MPGPIGDRAVGAGPGLPEADLARALVLLYRYTQDLTAAAAATLGPGFTSNRDVMILAAVAEQPGITPGELKVRLDVPRITVSRGTKRLLTAGLLQSAPGATDRRTTGFWLTAPGRRRLRHFESELRVGLLALQPLVKEAYELLRMAPPGEDLPRFVDPIPAVEAVTRVGAGFAAEAQAALEPFGIGEFMERHAITHLLLLEQARPTELAAELGLSPAGISGLLDRLEGAGLVTRRHDLVPGDRRAVLVELTDRGRDAVGLQLTLLAKHAPTLMAALGGTLSTSA